MTSPRRFEQDLPALLADLYLAGTPDYRDDLVQQTARVRQRPAWTFPERWLPMDVVTRPVSTPAFPWRQIGVLALIGLLIAAAAAVYVGSQPRLPEPFGLAANGLITYADGGDIYVRDSIDGSARVLVGGPDTENVAIFSPRGDRLALLRDADGGEDLWIGDADGSGLTRIGGPYLGPWLEWSPDQTQIVVGHVAKGIPTLELVAVDGSGSRRLVDMPAESPTFRPPDGTQLVFRGQKDGVWGYYLIDVAGGDPVRLAIDGRGIDGGDFDLQAPTWSPTGDGLVFHTLVDLPKSQLQTPGFRINVATIDPDGVVIDQEALEFSVLADDELNAAFTPDGSQIVFQRRFGWTPADPASGTPTVDTLLIAPADGSGPAIELGATSKNGDGIAYAVAPDGTSLIAHLWTEGEDWLIDTATGAAAITDLGSTSGVSWQRRSR